MQFIALLAPQARTFPRGEGGRAKRGRKRNGEMFRIRRSLLQRHFGNISARIPLQSPPCGGDSFPPRRKRQALPRQCDKLKLESQFSALPLSWTAAAARMGVSSIPGQPQS